MTLAMSTALSAMMVSQRVAETTSHNIANANTPGYSRQVTVLTPSLPIRTTAGIMGTGVTIERIMAIRDEFLNARIGTQKTALGRAEAQSTTLAEIEAIVMPDPTSNLGVTLDDFFEAINELANAPQSSVARESVRQSTATLCTTFHSTNSQLRQLRLHTKDQFDQTVSEANSCLQQIAELNGRIAAMSTEDDMANDLVDKRNICAEQLSKLVHVQFANDGTLVSVLLEGRLVVSGTDCMALETDATADGKLCVRVSGTSDVFEVTQGKLGGLAELYNDTIPRYIGYVDELASSLIREFNAVHSTGVGLQNGYHSLTSAVELADLDLNGVVGDEPLADQALSFPPEPGRLYITVTNESTGAVERSCIDYDPRVDSAVAIAEKIGGVNHMNASVTSGYLTLTAWPGYRFDFSNKLLPDAGSLGASAMSVSGAFSRAADRSYSFYPMSTGTIGQTAGLRVAVVDGSGTAVALLDVGAGYAPGTALAVSDGIKVSFSAGSVQAAEVLSAEGPFALADGDELTFSLNGGAPVSIAMHAADFADIAQATAREVADVINAAGAGVKADVRGDAVLIFPEAAGPGFSIQAGGAAAAKLGLPAGAAAADTLTIDALADTDTGKLLPALCINSFFEGDGAGSISLSAHVAANPDNIAAAKSSPPGDNANALKLSRLKSQRIANDGRQTLDDFFSTMVGRAGTDASQALRTEETQTKLVENLERQRESVAGVSLEEELAKLMQNQQAYSAAIRVLQTVDDMLAKLTSL